MEIRRAKPSEADALSAVARAAKAYWGYPEEWLRQWNAELTITPKFIAANEVFVALVKEKVVAFHALLKTPGEVRLEHLWVLPEQMHCGLGRKLFAHAAERARALGAASLTIEADPNAEEFYRHLGAIKVGSIVTEIQGHRRELPLLSFDLTGQFSREMGR